MLNPPQPSRQDLRRLGSLALGAAILVYLSIVTGSIVRVTGSTSACPDWPICFGAWTPPQADNALLDYLHRLTAGLALPMLVITSWYAWKRLRGQRLIKTIVAIALAMSLLQMGIGAAITLRLASTGGAWISALHLGLSLLILACLIIIVTITFIQQFSSTKFKLDYAAPFARFSLLTLVVVFLVLVSGAVVASSESGMDCPTWPLCADPYHSAGWINIAHRGLVLLAGIMVTVLLIRAWRTQRTQVVVLVASTAAVVLFWSQALLGIRLVQGFPPYLLVLHQATAVATWGVLLVQVVSVGMANSTAQEEAAWAPATHERKGLIRDLLMLTKPVVVLLLLVTTYAGMVIGAQSLPSLSLTFWTLLGGFMAAGGSGAINQYIDRQDDLKMQRTQKRPIPAGRLTPAEGLAFGVGMALASFYVFVAFVNFLAALLSLAGIIYYVLLYSIFLKKTTVQNIVIGGGAGAIPPLVGWAATTGSLNFPSLLLFAVIFMWTPPHFWALALVRRKDYARAGVPMLPVIRGEQETRWQIFLYTIELVGLTLLLPLFGLGGSLYLVGAVMLGGWLMLAAWKVWRQGGNKLAWKMYRYSSMYLAFLFLVLMIDRLL
jgi:protoheme IX farnesyltransferase